MRSDVAQLSTLFQLTTVRWRGVQRGANYEVTFTESAGQYQPGLKSSALSSLMHGAASKCSIFIILNTSVVRLRERLNTNEVIVLTLLRCYVATQRPLAPDVIHVSQVRRHFRPSCGTQCSACMSMGAGFCIGITSPSCYADVWRDDASARPVF